MAARSGSFRNPALVRLTRVAYEQLPPTIVSFWRLAQVVLKQAS